MKDTINKFDSIMSYPNPAFYRNSQDYNRALKEYQKNLNLSIKLAENQKNANEKAYKSGAYDSGMKLSHQRSIFYR